MQADVVTRESAERLAHILGPGSAAAQALACLDRGDHGPGSMIVRPCGESRLLVVPACAVSPAAEDQLP
jgi:hypothetical protein